MLQLFQVSYLVREYDEAIAYFTTALGFTLLEDTHLGNGKRWVRVAPAAQQGAALLLAKASGPAQTASIGQQGGGRVFLFLKSDQFWTDYARMVKVGVDFQELPRQETYGPVVVFKDLYGQKWDLIGST